jgi:hypothetical protein
MCFVFRQHKRLLMYYDVLPLTKMVIVASCFSSLKDKQDDHYDRS